MLEFFEAYLPLLGLLIFGNIENLVLSSQGVVSGAKPDRLLLLSILCVIFWLMLGTFGTEFAIQYSDIIEFIGGLAIFALGLQSMYNAVKSHRNKDSADEENRCWYAGGI